MASDDDRRVHERLPVPHVLVKISTPERMRVAYLQDLSKGGLFIKTDRPLPLDRLVDVDLLPPGRATPIRVRCKVVRVKNDAEAKETKSQGMGLKFVDLEPTMMLALDALLDEYQSSPAPAEQPLAPATQTVQLKQALEEIAALTEALADRDRELAEARQRREEIEARASAQVSPTDELQSELETARAEIGELQTRLSEALGDAEAYRHELGMMENDDAGMRRLAETLAQQKVELEETSASHLAEAARKLEAERARRVAVERSQGELANAHVQLTARVEEFEALLVAAREQMAAAVETTTLLEAARAQIAALQKAPAASRPSAPAPSVLLVPQGAAVDTDKFLSRLRANEPLFRLPRFNSFTPSDPRESGVMGLLEGCDRFSDLVVLARTMVTPVQLEKMLVGFHQLTLIAFER